MSKKTFIGSQLLQIKLGGRAALFQKMKQALNPKVLMGLYPIRELRVNLMMFALEYSPQNLTLVSGGIYKFPRKIERMRKTNSVLDDLDIIDDGGFFADEANLVMRGKSFDFEGSNIQENVYLLNGVLPKDYNHYNENEKKFNFFNRKVLGITSFPTTYVTADLGYAAICMDNRLPLIFFRTVFRFAIENTVLIKEIEKYCSDRNDSFIVQIHYKNKCDTIKPSSGLLIALSMSKLARKLNVFGWDCYMASSPKHLTHKQALNTLHGKELDKTMRCYFEMALLDWLYAYRLKELDHVDIHGHLNDVSYHPKLISKISRVYYES